MMVKKLTFLFVFLWIFSSPSFASGLGLHVAMADRAVEVLPAGELKDLLSRYPTIYRNGSLFPDIGHLAGTSYSEWSHWSEFLNAYGEKFTQTCPFPWNEDCQKLLVFYFGSLAHSMGDVNFDRYFVTAVAQEDFGGDIDKAQTFTDRDMDIMAMKEMKAVQENITFSSYQPTSFLLDIYQKAGYATDARDLRRQAVLTTTIYIGMLTYANHAYQRLSSQSRGAWGHGNYMTARGGYLESSERIAEIWQKVWEKLTTPSQRNLFPRLFDRGPWPHVDFGIEESL